MVETSLIPHSPDDPLPAKIGEFEIDEQGETKVGDGKVAHHLGQMGFGERACHLGIHDHQTIDQQIRHQGVHKLTVIQNIKTALLFDGVSTLLQFDDQGILIGLFIQAWLQSIQDLHRGSDDGLRKLAVEDGFWIYGWLN